MQFPRVIVGLSQTVLYDVLSNKPKHGRVVWREGVWSELEQHFLPCRDRRCLLLLSVDPGTNKQMYQHGDPGPCLEINPDRYDFAKLSAWLQECHQQEDARKKVEPTIRKPELRPLPARGIGRLAFWRQAG